MKTNESATVDRARFRWVRRASATAMARGGRRRCPPWKDTRGDVRMGGARPPVRPDLLVEALLSRR